jgi:hypothetical protein
VEAQQAQRRRPRPPTIKKYKLDLDAPVKVTLLDIERAGRSYKVVQKEATIPEDVVISHTRRNLTLHGMECDGSFVNKAFLLCRVKRDDRVKLAGAIKKFFDIDDPMYNPDTLHLSKRSVIAFGRGARALCGTDEVNKYFTKISNHDSVNEKRKAPEEDQRARKRAKGRQGSHDTQDQVQDPDGDEDEDEDEDESSASESDTESESEIEGNAS